MEKRTLYWIWVSLCFNWGSDHACEILSQCDNIETFYNYTEYEYLSMGIFHKDELKSILNKDLTMAEKIISDCQKLDINIVTIQDEIYPKRLCSIYGAPPVLYYNGDITGLDDAVVISIVGTRDAVDYTKNATISIASELAQAGTIIISGCAVGIDAAAHFGALKGKGRTIAILGCGLDINYPKENQLLKKEILKRGGALMSELPPGTTVRGPYFPVRNRIIAGLSLGVLLTHAPVKSGSLITAEHALEQGKEVYCLPPCNIFDAEFMGAMKYIRDGSTVVANAEDILMDFYFAYSDKLLKNKVLTEYIDRKRQYDKSRMLARGNSSSMLQDVIGSTDRSRPSLSDLEEPFKIEEPDDFTEESVRSEVELSEWNEEKEKLVEALDERQRTIYDLLGMDPKAAEDVSANIDVPMHEILSILTNFEISGIVQSFSGLQYARIHV